jgi:hypothetical protein
VTGHPTPFNSWLSMPCRGGMGCAVCVFMSVCLCVYACAWVCGYAHLVPALYEDLTSLQADNCTHTHARTHARAHAHTHSDQYCCKSFIILLILAYFSLYFVQYAPHWKNVSNKLQTLIICVFFSDSHSLDNEPVLRKLITFDFIF